MKLLLLLQNLVASLRFSDFLSSGFLLFCFAGALASFAPHPAEQLSFIPLPTSDSEQRISVTCSIRSTILAE
jgi:hypothetical protein